MRRRPASAVDLSAGLLMVDMLLNLVVACVVIQNSIAARNRVAIKAVTPVKVVAFVFDGRIMPIAGFGDRLITEWNVNNRPRVHFQFVGPTGGMFRTGRDDPTLAGAVGYESTGLTTVEINAQGVRLAERMMLLSPESGHWTVQVIVPAGPFWDALDGTPITMCRASLQQTEPPTQGLALKSLTWNSSEDNLYWASTEFSFEVP